MSEMLKVTCDAKTLRAVTAQGLRTVSTRGALQTLTCFLIHVTKTRLTVTSTDMEVFGRTRMDVSGAKPGTALVPAKRLDLVLGTFEGEVTLEQTEDELVVSQGKTRIKLLTFNPEDFPRVPELNGDEKPVVVLAPAFRSAVRFVKAHASTDDGRPVLCGASLEAEANRLYMVTTDSFRMAVTWAESASVKGALGESPIVRATALSEVCRLLKEPMDFVEMKRFERHLHFTVGDTEIIARLIDGQFPNWRQLKPEIIEQTTVVNREALSKALKRFTKLALTTEPVRLRFHDPDTVLKLSLIATDRAAMEDEIDVVAVAPVTKNRQPMEMGYNPTFLIECLDSFETTDISIGTINPLRPSVIHSDRDDEWTLIMPVRLQ